MPQPPFDIAVAHRWFAVECNNAAWDLLDQPQRDADESDRMAHLAHASMYHWRHAGDDLNELRALTLLTLVYVRLGDGATAAHYGARCAALSEGVGDRQSDFDRAMALGAAGRAFACNGDAVRSGSCLQRAARVAEALGADDRAVYERYCTPAAP